MIVDSLLDITLKVNYISNLFLILKQVSLFCPVIAKLSLKKQKSVNTHPDLGSIHTSFVQCP